MRGRRLGALIGAIGGLTFVLINAGGLPTALVAPARGLGLLAFLLVLWRAVLRPTPQALPDPRPSASAWRVYWTCVLAEALAIPVGATLINRGLERPELTVLWVVFVVGAHFLPFASVFRAPVFMALAWTLMGLALAGIALTLSGWSAAPGSVAVLAGFVLLGFSLSWTRAQPQATGPQDISQEPDIQQPS